MKIFFLNYNLSGKTALQICGYKYREDKKDLIREEPGIGRFHAKLINSNVVDIHFDLYVDYKHVVFKTPMKDRQEKIRIFKKLKRFKFKDFTKEEVQELNKKY